MHPLLVTAAFGYLLGSIPFGYILVRTFRGEDVRRSGSGNIGATNVSRTSPVLGVLTLVFDALKGLSAVVISKTLFPGQPVLLAIAGLAAIVGHMFPVWLRFRGGKGVATGLGSFVILFPKTILVMAGIFFAVFLVFRYVSLASVTAVALFPLLVWALQPPAAMPQMLALVTAASLLIVAKHRENIRRLWTHTEPRFQWRRG